MNLNRRNQVQHEESGNDGKLLPSSHGCPYIQSRAVIAEETVALWKQDLVPVAARRAVHEEPLRSVKKAATGKLAQRTLALKGMAYSSPVGAN